MKKVIIELLCGNNKTIGSILGGLTGMNAEFAQSFIDELAQEAMKQLNPFARIVLTIFAYVSQLKSWSLIAFAVSVLVFFLIGGQWSDLSAYCKRVINSIVRSWRKAVSIFDKTKSNFTMNTQKVHFDKTSQASKSKSSAHSYSPVKDTAAEKKNENGMITQTGKYDMYGVQDEKQYSAKSKKTDETASDSCSYQESGNTQFCPFCHCSIDKGAVFCSSCGKKIPAQKKEARSPKLSAGRGALKTNWITISSLLILCAAFVVVIFPTIRNRSYFAGESAIDADMSANTTQTNDEVYPYNTKMQEDISSDEQSVRYLVDDFRTNYMFDKNRNTAFTYLIWKSNREDNTPDIKCYFNNATIGYISILSGKVSSKADFIRYAHPTRLKVVVNTSDGSYPYYWDLSDDYAYAQNYQCLGLDHDYPDVQSIEFYLYEYKKGTEEQYQLAITELLFTSHVGIK